MSVLNVRFSEAESIYGNKMFRAEWCLRCELVISQEAVLTSRVELPTESQKREMTRRIEDRILETAEKIKAARR